MVISLLPTFSVSAVESDEATGLSCNSNGSITEYTGTAENLVIPDNINGVTINRINDDIFLNHAELKSVTIPGTVEYIGDDVFRNCTGLKGITIPESVTWLGSNAFEGCTELTEITIPESLTEIDYELFKGCTKLTNITLHNNITSIGYDAFLNTGYYNNALNWEDGVLYIGKYLVASNENVPEIYEVKDGTELIAQKAFDSYDTIKKVVIPESVKYILWRAFGFCDNLEDIQILGDNVKIISGAFSYTAYYYKSSNWEDKVLYIGKHLYETKSTIPNSVTVKAGTTTITDSAFARKTNITEINLPDGLLRIGEYAFNGCTGLGSLTIPESVTDIDRYAFNGCTGIASVVIPESVSNMGERAFNNCTYLKSATIKNAPVADFMFNGCTALKNVTLGDKVENIGEYAFSNCAMESMVIPKNVKKIDKNAFEMCKKLKQVTIQNGVTSIGEYAFYFCEKLAAAYIPTTIKTIGKGAFQYCSSLEEVVIPDGVTAIAGYTFLSCKSLTSIVIPKSVTSIGNEALRNCDNLVIRYKGTEAEWNAITKDSSDTFENVNYNYVLLSKTTVEVVGNTYTVTGDYIDGCTVILALYKEDGKGNKQLVDCKTAVYIGAAIPFQPTVTDYTTARVIVLNSLETLEPSKGVIE